MGKERETGGGASGESGFPDSRDSVERIEATGDAGFADGVVKPLNLGALDDEDLKVLAALAQDAVFPATEMKWDPGKSRFAILLNRFRWEDREAAARRGRGVERVQSLLVFESVTAVASQGIDKSDGSQVLSLLDIACAESGDGRATLTLVLAGDGAIRLEVEALDGRLKDVTRPYLAPSKAVPTHRD